MKIKTLTLALFVIVSAAQAQWNYDNQSVIYSSGGNVGIGATDPQVRLDLGTTQGSGLQFRFNSGTSYRIRLVPYWNTSEDTRLDFNVERNTGTFTTVMSVGYNYNVGIGTTTASGRLTLQNTTTDLYSGLLIRDGSGNNRGAIYYNGAQDLVIDALSAPSGDVSTFKIRTGGADRITVMKDGNVGVGTTSPTYKLHVNGISLLGSGTESGAYIGNVNAAIWQRPNNNLVLYNNGYDRLVIQNNGNVGIGMTTPNEKLTVNGNQSVSGNLFLGADGGIATIAGPANSGAIQIKTNSALGGSSNRYLRLGWKDNNSVFSAALSINDNLNVGIGTLNPDTKLSVKGVVHAEEVRVDLNVPAPDYVFEKEYDLLSLSELETYVKANKHLPEVPSAKEIEANGLNLKEMNLLLLKKVEELTLHLIQQQKEIESLKSKIK